MKIKTAFALGALGALGAITAAQGDLLVYEPFDYVVDLTDPVLGAQNGKDGGVGFAGPWEDLTSGSNDGEGFIYDSTGNTNGTNDLLPDWDGVIDNLPTSGGYVGLSPYVSDQFEDRNNSRRLLEQSAGAMAGADGVLWMSMAIHFQDNRFNFSPGLMFTDGGGFSERVRDMTDSSTGIGIGHGSAWGIDLNAITYNAGTFDTRTNVSNISTALDNVIILKFEFGAESDKVSTWYFTEDQTMTEADFDTNALATTSTFNIDENTLTTLAVGLTRAGNAFDEIRIGDTFDDVTTGTVAGAAPLQITGIVHDGVADTVTLTWTARANTSYIAKYSRTMDDAWDSEMEDSLGTANDENPDDGDKITVTFALTNHGLEEVDKVFFRIEEE